MIGLLVAAFAQSPSAEWRVAETEHYLVHYPAAAEEWTLRTVGRMESIRAAVAEEVGWVPRFRTQVLVQDPYSESNGMALPLGRSPRIVLWTTPPGADSVIGHYRDPGDLLMTHEDAHIVHMMMPPRGLSGQLFAELFKLSPITVKSPRWVIEGYATVVEGRLTGSGRPHADIRGTWLRRLAQQGALPSYGELSGSPRWGGFGYAYLVGSAYLEWLDARQGGGSLPKLWARMTAKKVRSFDQAFTGLYGESAPILYRRFCAEVTADAMAADGADWDRSSLWMDTRAGTGRPALSPDGSQLAVVMRPMDGPSRLKVIEVAVDDEAVARRAERIAKLLERDPDDGAAADLAAPPHKTAHTLVDRTHSPRDARWLDDDHLIYDAPVFDRDGRMRRDLFIWSLETGRVRRLTHGEDLRRVDVQAGVAVAVRSRFGRTQLVRVDLTTGQTEALTPLSAAVIVDQPRLSPDGTAVVYLRHEGQGFRPVVLDLGGAERALEVPSGATAMHVAWGPDGVVATLGVEARIDIWRLGDEPGRLTVSGASLAPEPSEQGLFHLQVQADGYEIHRVDPDLRPAPEGGLGLVGRAGPVKAPVHPIQPMVGRAMALGRLEPRMIVGGMVGYRASNLEIGARLGDLVGRNEFVLNGALGDAGGVTGATLWWANRTLPADLELRSWLALDGFGQPAWIGGHLGFTWDAQSTTAIVEAQTGVFAEQQLGSNARASAFAEVSGAWIEPRTRMIWFRGSARALVGRDGEVSTSYGELSSGFDLGRTWSLSTDYTIGRAGGNPVSLGGVTSGIRSLPAQWTQLRVGWAAPGEAVGTVHDAMIWAVQTSGFSLFVERRRIWGALGVGAHSVAGLRIVQGVERQPLVRAPAVEIEIGLGCAFEQGGPVDKPCRRLDHYRAWSGLVWRPR